MLPRGANAGSPTVTGGMRPGTAQEITADSRPEAAPGPRQAVSGPAATPRGHAFSFLFIFIYFRVYLILKFTFIYLWFCFYCLLFKIYFYFFFKKYMFLVMEMYGQITDVCGVDKNV